MKIFRNFGHFSSCVWENSGCRVSRNAFSGAEAKIYKLADNGTEYVVKERFSKCYRVKELDESVSIGGIDWSFGE